MEKIARAVKPLSLSKRRIFPLDTEPKRTALLVKPLSLSRQVPFQVATEPKSEVFLAGTFNNWDPRRHPMKNIRGRGKYSLILMLPKGEYEYKFVVNGNWIADPENQRSAPNTFGTANSVVKVE